MVTLFLPFLKSEGRSRLDFACQLYKRITSKQKTQTWKTIPSSFYSFRDLPCLLCWCAVRHNLIWSSIVMALSSFICVLQVSVDCILDLSTCFRSVSSRSNSGPFIWWTWFKKEHWVGERWPQTTLHKCCNPQATKQRHRLFGLSLPFFNKISKEFSMFIFTTKESTNTSEYIKQNSDYDHWRTYYHTRT